MVTVPATSLNLPLFQHRCEHSETKNVHLQLPLTGRTIPIIVRGAVSLLLIGIHYQTKGGLSCKLNITTRLEKNGLCVDYPVISPSWDGSERFCCFCSGFSFSKFSPSSPQSRPECPERQSFRRRLVCEWSRVLPPVLFPLYNCEHESLLKASSFTNCSVRLRMYAHFCAGVKLRITVPTGPCEGRSRVFTFSI